MSLRRDSESFFEISFKYNNHARKQAEREIEKRALLWFGTTSDVSKKSDRVEFMILGTWCWCIFHEVIIDEL